MQLPAIPMLCVKGDEGGLGKGSQPCSAGCLISALHAMSPYSLVALDRPIPGSRQVLEDLQVRCKEGLQLKKKKVVATAGVLH